MSSKLYKISLKNKMTYFICLNQEVRLQQWKSPLHLRSFTPFSQINFCCQFWSCLLHIVSKWWIETWNWNINCLLNCYEQFPYRKSIFCWHFENYPRFWLWTHEGFEAKSRVAHHELLHPLFDSGRGPFFACNRSAFISCHLCIFKNKVK